MATIDSDEENAYVTWAGGFRYELKDDMDENGLWHPHTFAEAKVRADMTERQDWYNLQVQARATIVNGTSFKAYAAKLIKGPRGCNAKVPALFVIRMPAEGDDEEGEYGLAKCLDLDGDGTAESLPVVPGTNPEEWSGTYCDENVPLDVRDGNSGRSLPAWIGIEVKRDDGPEADPLVIGRVVWYEGDPPVEHSCTFSRQFYGDPGEMNYVRHGKWGMGFHEKSYFVDYFRAGYTAEVAP